ncbi:uncharacterized protein MONBRDRAFT_25618 [Monosiga brevicollis MX1]|uniref:p53 DNA-binding domain-containing protein n=1 Tax=Monosiga brevicollis TaxID=81824 RepID=A9UZX3_MONBE|nr:uncharacterized protein MONBRDRAFT_25618 [Monosiga brevicollis MX1]EDQ88915.1 predicted protein [Monosiga brevicollis MX1]|eukprot:XP_001746020.1 hypothetical protein [Monosiga brevicollis MX1]
MASQDTLPASQETVPDAETGVFPPMLTRHGSSYKRMSMRDFHEYLSRINKDGDMASGSMVRRDCMMHKDGWQQVDAEFDVDIDILGGQLPMDTELVDLETPLPGTGLDDTPQASAKPCGALEDSGEPNPAGFRANLADSSVAAGPGARAIGWTYSPILNTLFTPMDYSCPIRFATNESVPDLSRIVAHLEYTQTNQRNFVVNRCDMHRQGDSGPFAEHVLRVNNPQANYHQRQERLAVSVPVASTRSGKVEQNELFEWHCLTSCAGGINRRKIRVVFRLIDPDQNVLGVQHINVRVCACPVRDRRTHEKAHAKREQANDKRNVIASDPTPSKKPKLKDHPISMALRKMPSVSTLCQIGSGFDHDQDVQYLAICGRANYEVALKVRDQLNQSAGLGRVAASSVHLPRSEVTLIKQRVAEATNLDEFLRACNLQSLKRTLENLGYTDLPLIATLDAREIEELTLTKQDQRRLKLALVTLNETDKAQDPYLARRRETKLMRVTVRSTPGQAQAGGAGPTSPFAAAS